MPGHSRSKNGVASLAYARASMRLTRCMDCRIEVRQWRWAPEGASRCRAVASGLRGRSAV